MTRTDLPYLVVRHFKGLSDSGQIQLRDIYLPGANEALAEAALLAECARHPGTFGNPPNVYSYPLASRHERSGLFPHYIHGFAARQARIASACDEEPQGVVRYIDIRQFYPSIRRDLALSVWRKAAEAADLAQYWYALGEKLIEDHSSIAAGNEACILTGPMFSHLLGNLVLRKADEELSSKLPVTYVRYVDDITLIGPEAAVNESLSIVRAKLLEIGDFRIHEDTSPKSLVVPACQWVSCRHDFSQSTREISWMTLVGDLRKFLIVSPNLREELQKGFLNEGYRLPILDYSNAVFEQSYVERFDRWFRSRWIRQKAKSITIANLLEQAQSLRASIETELLDLLRDFDEVDDFERKRRVPKLRYRAGRLAYLATEDTLTRTAKLVHNIPEMYLHAVAMNAIASGCIDDAIRLGANAAQAIAQPLRAARKDAYLAQSNLGTQELQSLAVLRLNGVNVQGLYESLFQKCELLNFAEHGASRALMTSGDPFLREISSLHGICEVPRHPEVLESVFDEDEELTLDVLEQLQRSLSI
jgi:hypothetical protein